VQTIEKIGGARRDRTADLLHAMQALSQLSYGPTERHAKVRKRRRAVKKEQARPNSGLPTGIPGPIPSRGEALQDTLSTDERDRRIDRRRDGIARHRHS
jgi:hypothetical protein